MAIYSEFSHEKWWFSIVFCMFTRGYPLHCLVIFTTAMDWSCCDSPISSLGQCRQVQKAGRRGASIVSTVHQRSAELHLWITYNYMINYFIYIYINIYFMHTSWLVVLNIFWKYFFHINWEFHHPNWRTHIFQRSIETTGIPPTSKKIRQYHVICMWCLQEMVGHLQPPSFPEQKSSSSSSIHERWKIAQGFGDTETIYI